MLHGYCVKSVCSDDCDDSLLHVISEKMSALSVLLSGASDVLSLEMSPFFLLPYTVRPATPFIMPGTVNFFLENDCDRKERVLFRYFTN